EPIPPRHHLARPRLPGGGGRDPVGARAPARLVARRLSRRAGNRARRRNGPRKGGRAPHQGLAALHPAMAVPRNGHRAAPPAGPGAHGRFLRSRHLDLRAGRPLGRDRLRVGRGNAQASPSRAGLAAAPGLCRQPRLGDAQGRGKPAPRAPAAPGRDIGPARPRAPAARPVAPHAGRGPGGRV
ncbi:MAG: polyketide cyclase/dehydrase, partial [uncultured Rubellimicrobium sp.]